MTALWLSLALPLVAPVAAALPWLPTTWRARFPQLHAWGVAAIAVVLIAVVLPGTYQQLGVLALGLAALPPLALAGLQRALRGSLDPDLLVAATLGALLLHAMIDGVALFSFGAKPSFGWALALDRLALGGFVWTTTRARLGRVAALLALAAVAVATVGGYALAAQVVAALGDPRNIAGFQALVSGLVGYIAFSHRCTEPAHAPHAHPHASPGALLDLAAPAEEPAP
jgi:hypothetical protein